MTWGWGRRLDSPAAQDGDCFAVQVGEGDGAEVAGVLGLGAVVAQDEHVALGDDVGVFVILAGIGGVHDFAALGGAVDLEGALLGDGHHVALPGYDAADPYLPFRFVEHNIIFGKILLDAVDQQQVAVFHGGEHLIAADLMEGKYLGEQNKQHQHQQDDPEEQAAVALGDDYICPAAANDFGNCGDALGFLSHLHPPKARLPTAGRASGAGAYCSGPVLQ